MASATVSEERRRTLVSELVRVRDEERRRLARDLHDEAGQLLTALTVGLRALEALETAEEMRAHAAQLHAVASDTLDSLSRLARGLYPLALGEQGVCAAIEQHVREWPQRGIAVTLDAAGFDDTAVRPELAEALYRMVLEALTNVQRHSGARHARVALWRRDDAIEAIVEDDGRGCDLEMVLADARVSGALGLRAIAERAATIGGTVDLVSRPGLGMRVAVRVPAG